jgi:hypothetical protein
VDKLFSGHGFSLPSSNLDYDRQYSRGWRGRGRHPLRRPPRPIRLREFHDPIDQEATVSRLFSATARSRTALAAAACAAFALSQLELARAEPLHLASHYAASGSNPDGSKYTGNADVDVISDTTFSIVWKIEGQRYEGFGMRLNDALAATYMINGEPGLIIYKVDGNGLTGAWAIRGHDGVGTEHLRPLN